MQRKKRKLQKERKKTLGRQKAFCVCGYDYQDHIPHYVEPDSTESDHRWDDIIMKEKKVQEELEREKDILESKYGKYVDPQPCFSPRSEVSQIKLPIYIDVHDRIALKAKMLELESSREQAKEVACYYRDRFYESKIKIEELKLRNSETQVECHRQNQKVCYFWRNQVLEENTLSGRIFKMALSKSSTSK